MSPNAVPVYPNSQTFNRTVIVIGIFLASAAVGAFAQGGSNFFAPDNLVISRSVYDNNPNNVQVGQLLPPNCQATQAGCNGNATYDGTYPLVWNNDAVDGSFGITAKILLDLYTPAGQLVNSLEVRSFADGTYLTFMGYLSAIDTLDVSNSNTPAVVDPTNPVGTAYNRVLAQVDTVSFISR